MGPVRVSKTVPKKTCNVPDHYPQTHHTNTIINEFVPPHVPAAVVPAPVPVTTTPAVATTSPLDDILNRENTDNTFDRFVFEEENVTNAPTLIMSSSAISSFLSSFSIYSIYN